MLESEIERACCNKAWQLYSIKNFKLFKLMGYPDRIFYKAGALCFVEFKRPGATPRKLQAHVHKQLREDGFEVFIIDDITEGLKVLKEFFKV